VSDIGCAQWDWDKQICLKCSNNWYLNINNKCAQISPLCNSSDSNGNCMSCYKGYSLLNGSCVLTAVNLNQSNDLGCHTWNW
jgi:hypothetical protein